MAKQKFYVVWRGRKPGVYNTWDECRAQVIGFKDATYRSFPTRREAEDAYKESSRNYVGKSSSEPTFTHPRQYGNPIQESICVDAACDTTTGLMEYKGIYLKTGKVLFL